MFDSTTPDRPNPAPAPGLDPRVDPGGASRLLADAYRHLTRTLCVALPPPPSDCPEALAQRNHAAIVRVAALVPANAAEADLAALFVVASEQAKHRLALAQAPETSPEVARACDAQASRMMCRAESVLRLLLKLQEARRKREADPAACTSAAWTEHCALNLMAEALAGEARSAAPAPCPDTGMAEPPAPPPAPEPPLVPALQPAPVAEPEPMPFEDAEPDLVAEAAQYAAIYPDRAALIRRVGRVPDNVSFGPPDPDLVQTLITARTPALAALDREYAPAHAA